MSRSKSLRKELKDQVRDELSKNEADRMKLNDDLYELSYLNNHSQISNANGTIPDVMQSMTGNF